MSEVMHLRNGVRLRVEEMLPVGFAKVMKAVDQFQVEGERLAAARGTKDGLEVVAIEHLDFDPPCEWRLPDDICSEAATMSGSCIACGRVVALCCDRHVVASKAWPHAVRCKACNATGTMGELLRFTPLGGI